MHDGTGEPAFDEIDYEWSESDLALEQALEEWHDYHWTHRVHRFKIGREGFRELLLSKGWGMRGAYSSKFIAGRECIISGVGGDHPDYLIAKICLKQPAEKPLPRQGKDPLIQHLKKYGPEVTEKMYRQILRGEALPEKWLASNGTIE